MLRALMLVLLLCAPTIPPAHATGLHIPRICKPLRVRTECVRAVARYVLVRDDTGKVRSAMLLAVDDERVRPWAACVGKHWTRFRQLENPPSPKPATDIHFQAGACADESIVLLEFGRLLRAGARAIYGE